MPDRNEWFRWQANRRVEPRQAGPATPVPTAHEGLQAYAEGNNDFALSLFEDLRHSPGNLFFSPFSIRTALAMAYHGAKGETADQMREALRIATSNAELARVHSDITEGLGTVEGGDSQLLAANSIWAQLGEPLLHPFQDLMIRQYRGTVRQVGFREDPEAARATINQWVETQTRGKIRELISQGSLDPQTSLALVNTIFFKGRWATPFESSATEEEIFYTGRREGVRVPLMQQEGVVSYHAGRGFQAVDLPYYGDLSMLVLLPKRKTGLPALEERLSAGMLRECVARMESRPVNVFLPRFEFAWGTADVSANLARLGMPLAFTSGAADFSGINGEEPPSEESLFLSSVFHRAQLDVTEEGTEAAAATAIVICLGASLGPSRPPRVPVFRADHPFLFAVRDRKSGSILFLGRLSDPTPQPGMQP